MDHGDPDRILKHSAKSIEFSVNVLTMGHWPSYQPMEVVIPPDLAEYQDLFQKVLLPWNYLCLIRSLPIPSPF